MKRIAIILYSNVIGGHEFQAIEMAKDLMKFNKVDLFVDNNLDLKRIGLKNNNIHKLEIYKQGLFLIQFFYSFKFRSQYASIFKDYDLIIISGGTIESTIAVGYALKHLNTVAYVPMYIDRYKLWKNCFGLIYNYLHSAFCRPLNGLITINKIQAKLFSRYKDKIVIIPNRIKSEIVNNLPYTSDKRRLYFVGRLERSKGIIELIEMLDDVNNPFKEFVIVGDGSLFESINNKSKNLKYIKVALHGWLNIEQQNILFNNKDVYVTNSLFEGEPLAIREANSRHSIVIARNIDGHRGCVQKKNRYNNRAELYKLLHLAYNNELPLTYNTPSDEVEISRARAIEQISIL